MSERIASYRELTVWQKAMDLVVKSYDLAKLLPRTDAYGLTDQIRRAAVSIPEHRRRLRQAPTRRVPPSPLHRKRITQRTRNPPADRAATRVSQRRPNQIEFGALLRGGPNVRSSRQSPAEKIPGRLNA